MAIKYSSFGTILKMSDGAATPVFTAVAGVQDIDGPEYTTDAEDVTAHDSPNAFEEKVPTIKRSGEITFPIVYDPADPTHASLIDVWQDRDTVAWQIVAPTTPAETIEVDAFVSRWGRSYPVSGGLMANIGLNPTGEPTITTA